jgi:Winged helix DNA-binding domain
VAERTLTQRELNRAVLARQLLLERAMLPIPRALERMGGIQNQYAPNAYIRLWSCLEGFRREDLTRALERRSVVNATLMRSTIHVVSKRDYWPLAVAIRAPQREW